MFSGSTVGDGVWCSFIGRIDHTRATRLQLALREEVLAKSAVGCILLLEHPHTITLGRSASPEADLKTPVEDLQHLGFRVTPVSRGGRATYHGPGQLVGYHIVNLKRLKMGTRQYVEKLGQVIVKLLQQLGVTGEYVPGRPGVYVAGSKIAALGVHVHRGVTTHGFAVNVTTDLEQFGHIVPCGMPDCATTSVLQETGTKHRLVDLAPLVADAFQAVFGLDVQLCEPDGLLDSRLGR